MKCAHGTEETEESFLKEGTDKKERQNQYAQGGHDHGDGICKIHKYLRCITNEQWGYHSTRTDLTEWGAKIF